MVMPIRIALGAVEGWEILLSVALSLALIPVLVWCAGGIYSSAVLHSGSKVKLAAALRGPEPLLALRQASRGATCERSWKVVAGSPFGLGP